MSEGSSREVSAHAAWEGLDNLTPIIDVNRLGQTRETMTGWDMDANAAPARAFGWHAVIVDAIGRAFTEVAAATGEPTVLLARCARLVAP